MLMLLMMLMMMMMTTMMMMMRGRWWCGCLGRGGGGRWWCWGGWCWGGRPIPRPGSTLCASRSVHGHFTRAILWKFTGKVPYAKPATPVLCEPAQSKCTWTCQKRHLCGNLRGKCRTLLPRPAFCASLRSRNAHGHVTRGILCGNLQGKCRTPQIPPRLNTGP